MSEEIIASMMKFNKASSDVQIMPSITDKTVVSFDGKDQKTGDRVAYIMFYTSDEEAHALMKAYPNADTICMSTNSGKLTLVLYKNTEADEKELFRLKISI